MKIKLLIAFLLSSFSLLGQYPSNFSWSNSCGGASTLNFTTTNDCAEVGTSAMPTWTSSVNFNSYSNSGTGGNSSPSYDYCEDVFSLLNTNNAEADIWVKVTTDGTVSGLILEALNESYSGNTSNQVEAGIVVYKGSSCPGGGTSPEQLVSNRCPSIDLDNTRLIDKYSSSNSFYGINPQIDLDPNSTYYIRIFVTNGSDKNFTSDIQLTPVPTPQSNNYCSNAEVINSEIIGCNYGNYSANPFHNHSCITTTENSSYYSITKTNSGPFSVTLDNIQCSNGGNSLQAALYKTNNCTLNDPTFQDCRDGSGIITLSAINDSDPIGTEYILWVDGNSGSVCSWGVTDNNNPPCAASLDVTPPPTFCLGTNVDLSSYVTASNANSVTYHTSLGDAQTGSNPIGGTTVNTAGTYYVRAYNTADNCFSTAEIVINYQNPTTPTFSYVSGCVNGVATISSENPGGGTYSVVALDGDSPTINTSNGELSNITNTNRYDVTYTINDGVCGTQSTTQTYTADICNNCNLSPSSGGAICPGDVVNISATGNCDIPDVVSYTNTFNSNREGWSTGNGDHSFTRNGSCGSNQYWLESGTTGTRFTKSSVYDLSDGDACEVSFNFYYGNGSCSGPNASNETVGLYYKNANGGNPSNGTWTLIGTLNSSGLKTFSLPAGAISATTYFSFYQANGTADVDRWGFDNFSISCDQTPNNTITWTSTEDPSINGTTTTSGQVLNRTPAVLPVTYTVTITDVNGGSITETITFTQDPSCTSCTAEAGTWDTP